MSAVEQDIEDLAKAAKKKENNLSKNTEDSFPIPKSRSKKILARPIPSIDSDYSSLNELISNIDPKEPFKNYQKLDILFTKLRHKNALTQVPYEILSDFVHKMHKIISSKEVEFSKSYIKEAKKLIKILEPSKSYLNLIGTPEIDQRLLIDEMLEIILKLVQNSLGKLIIPLSQHPNKESCKILENIKIKECLVSICGILEHFCDLIQKHCFQDHHILNLSELLIKTLFAEGAEMLHLSCCYSLASIVNAYNKLTLQILNEIINNLLVLTSDPNMAIGSKSKRIHCRDYTITEGIEIKFSTFMLINVLQNYSSLEIPIRANGEVEMRLLNDQLHETLGLSQHFVNELGDRSFKVRSESQEYRNFFDVFIQDIIKLIYRPEFSICFLLLNLIVIKMFAGLKTISAVIRHYIIDELSLIAGHLKDSIHKIKASPIVPQNIVKVPLTSHPSENLMASICLCKEGWSEARAEMVQCEECWKWFHLDCVGLDIDKYTDACWYCDDCRLFECLSHLELQRPAIKEDELTALPQEIVYICQEYQKVFQELIANYMISNCGRLDSSSRSILLAHWLQAKHQNNLISLWQTPSKTPNLPRLSEKGTIKLIRQYLIVFDLGLTYLHIQQKIIGLLSASQPLTRARAIKSLCLIVASDPECLTEDMIESAVIDRLHDSSIAVREATVELLGKFITYNSEYSDSYYSALIMRLKDKGPSVRKRVIKILKDIISMNPEHERSIEIYCEVIKRIADDSEGIRDAVASLFEEVWFSCKPNKFFISVIKVIKIIKIKEPIVLLFKAVLQGNEKYKEQLEQITLICTEQLVASANIHNSILYAKLLETISHASPELLVEQISVIHQFLTPSQNSIEEAEVINSICTIVGRASEYIGSLHLSRVKRIESQLLDLVYTQGSAVLTQALLALCKIVRLCSRNQGVLTNLMQKCFTLLKSFLKSKEIEHKQLPSVFRALLALGLCVKFYDSAIFDTFELERSKGFRESIFECFESIATVGNDLVRERALDALSLTWVRFPELLLKSDKLIKKAWQNATTPATKLKMLEMFFEFLKHCNSVVCEENEEDKGNVVAYIQGYLDSIMICAKDLNSEVRESAAEVLKLIFLQGTINASKIISVLFCMLGDENSVIRDSGYYCIEKSFSKNPDLVTINLQQSLKDAFDYQSKLVKLRDLPETYYPKLYILLRPKKGLRIKFLSSIISLLEPNGSEFTEFLCEFLSILPYTSFEELIPIIDKIGNKIQTSAFRLFRIIKVRINNKVPLENDQLQECLLQIQLILMKNYLFTAYQIKNLDENPEKSIQRVESVAGFIEEYEEYRQYSNIGQLEGEELKKFKQRFKQCIGTQSLDDLPTKKRIRKTLDSNQFSKQTISL